MTNICASMDGQNKSGADCLGKSGNGWFRRVDREFGQELFHERVVPPGGPGIRPGIALPESLPGVKSTCSSN